MYQADKRLLRVQQPLCTAIFFGISKHEGGKTLFPFLNCVSGGFFLSNHCKRNHKPLSLQYGCKNPYSHEENYLFSRREIITLTWINYSSRKSNVFSSRE